MADNWAEMNTGKLKSGFNLFNLGDVELKFGWL